MSQTYHFMASQSKEENVLKLILESSPLKEWHFKEVVREANVTKSVANKWLKKYVYQGLLKKVKEKGAFPFFTVGSNNLFYNSLKRVFALEQLHKSGLISELLSLDAKTIIIFGSTIKGDWYKGSDIDIFVFGNSSDFDKTVYERRMNKHIELHIFENRRDLTCIKTGLINNVVNGYVVKGQIQDIVKVV